MHLHAVGSPQPILGHSLLWGLCKCWADAVPAPCWLRGPGKVIGYPFIDNKDFLLEIPLIRHVALGQGLGHYVVKCLFHKENVPLPQKALPRFLSFELSPNIEQSGFLFFNVESSFIISFKTLEVKKKKIRRTASWDSSFPRVMTCQKQVANIFWKEDFQLPNLPQSPPPPTVIPMSFTLHIKIHTQATKYIRKLSFHPQTRQCSDQEEL